MPRHCDSGESQCGKGRNGQMHLLDPTGYGRRHGEKDMQSKLGNLSGTTLDETDGEKIRCTNTNKSAEVPRDSDAAIVSDDPVGQYNPLASQGPLDWSVLATDPVSLSERTIGVACRGRVMAYKSSVIRCRCVSYANGRATGRRRSPWLISSLKPYWGKPAVRNFRGGGGNVCKVWRLFATQLERADTTEADRPTHGAPSLYSTKIQRTANPDGPDWLRSAKRTPLASPRNWVRSASRLSFPGQTTRRESHPRWPSLL